MVTQLWAPTAQLFKDEVRTLPYTKVKFWDCCQCRNVIEVNEGVNYALDESMDRYCTNEDCEHPRCYSCHNLDPNLKRIYGPGDKSDSETSTSDEADQDGESENDDSGHESDNRSNEAESKCKGKVKEVAEDGDAYHGDNKSEEGGPVNALHDHVERNQQTNSPRSSTSAGIQCSKRSSPNSSLHESLSLIERAADGEDEASDGEVFDIDEDIMEIYGDMLESLGLADVF